jgi:hypothetical protein
MTVLVTGNHKYTPDLLLSESVCKIHKKYLFINKIWLNSGPGNNTYAENGLIIEFYHSEYLSIDQRPAVVRNGPKPVKD